jgi:exopolysaccharide production protein ExoQ
MPPTVALTIWLVLLFALLVFDPAKERGTSLALWVPVTWIFIVATRLPSQWLTGSVSIAEGSLEEGNPLDRSVFLVLIFLAIGILVARSFKWGDFFASNVALMSFVGFALLSVIWSDTPFIAFKRWFRDLGNYLMVLVAWSDSRPTAAVATLLRRLGYLLIPLSILLIKYYPAIGMGYNFWTGTAMYAGPATSKNGLGVICLVSGLFFFWDTVARWHERRQRPVTRIILVNLAFLAMTLWLLHRSDSATSRVCLVIGCLVIAAAQSRRSTRNPTLLKTLIPLCFLLYVILAWGFDMNGKLAQAVGRNPNLTERTDIWRILLSLHTNPLIGTGYESFWVGRWLRLVWQHKETAGLNEAHNGYLEVYLSLGLIGLFLLAGFLASSYRAIWKRLAPQYRFRALALGLWTILLFYNVTEAAFRGSQLMWSAFLLGAVFLPARSAARAGVISPLDGVQAAGRTRGSPFEVASVRR